MVVRSGLDATAVIAALWSIAVTVMVGMVGAEFIKVTHKRPLRRSVTNCPRLPQQ
jgi:hypothetical protein